MFINLTLLRGIRSLSDQPSYVLIKIMQPLYINDLLRIEKARVLKKTSIDLKSGDFISYIKNIFSESICFINNNPKVLDDEHIFKGL